MEAIPENKFRLWFDTIPTGEARATKWKVINDCKITEQIFKHWKCGNSKVPPLAQGIINTIAGKIIFE